MALKITFLPTIAFLSTKPRQIAATAGALALVGLSASFLIPQHQKAETPYNSTSISSPTQTLTDEKTQPPTNHQ